MVLTIWIIDQNLTDY